MEVSKQYILYIQKTIKHLERITTAMPQVPENLCTRDIDAWRLLKHEDIRNLKRILSKWQQSIGE